MLVRMKSRIGGYRNGAPWPEVGDTIDLPDHEAADMITNGYAEEYHDAPEPDLEGQDPSSEPDGEPGNGSNETPSSYENLTVPALDAILEERELSTDGLKPDKVARLEAADSVPSTD